MTQLKLDYKMHMGNDDAVVDFARVSFNKLAKDYTPEQNERLIKYLAKHNHWTPFASSNLVVRMKLPIWLHGQLVKHRIGGTINTISRRYVKTDIEFYQPDWREAPKGSIKQGSGTGMDISDRLRIRRNEAIYSLRVVYDALLLEGVAPEQARGDLPQNLMTECMVNGTLPFWARMFQQRTSTSSQQEWLSLMQQLDEVCQKLWPIAWKALNEEKNY